MSLKILKKFYFYSLYHNISIVLSIRLSRRLEVNHVESLPSGLIRTKLSVCEIHVFSQTDLNVSSMIMKVSIIASKEYTVISPLTYLHTPR